MSGQTDIFIEKSKKIHGELYDYSMVLYSNAKTKVQIICAAHGDFWMTPNNHLSGNKCPKCRGRFDKKQDSYITMQILKAKQIHGDVYDYSNVEWSKISKTTKVKIICKLHGEFFQIWGNHVGKSNQNKCPQCSISCRVSKSLLGLENFIAKAKDIHGEIYDYSNAVYTGAHNKLTISCKIHGEFQCTPANHWSNGVGCPSCLCMNPSKAESKIAKWLDKNNIKYEYQKSYPDLFYKSKNGRLKYDFYLPDYNILIEYDGEHHFQPITWSSKVDGNNRLQEQQIRDKIKTDYAIKNNIRLTRISYNDSIDEYLSNTIVTL